jgi:hypothetical protein
MLTSEKKIKEGRHVGLDFYDLLIEEALKTPSNVNDVTTVITRAVGTRNTIGAVF